MLTIVKLTVRLTVKLTLAARIRREEETELEITYSATSLFIYRADNGRAEDNQRTTTGQPKKQSNRRRTGRNCNQQLTNWKPHRRAKTGYRGRTYNQQKAACNKAEPPYFLF